MSKLTWLFIPLSTSFQMLPLLQPLFALKNVKICIFSQFQLLNFLKMFSIFVDLGDLNTNYVTLNKIGKLLSCSFPFFYFFGFLTNANRYQLRYFKLLFKGHCFLKFWFFDLIQFSESLDCAIVKIYQTLLFISRLDPGQYFAGLFVILNKNKIKKIKICLSKQSV